MRVIVGTRLGPYEIVSPLGAGGMGEVYRARDTRLGRDVAVKVLPTSFSADKDRLQRFEQEACAAGALNHPNYSLDNKLMSVDVNTNANNFEAGTPKVLFEARLVPGQPTGAGAYSVTRDGQRFLTNLLADDSSPSPAVVVQNWTASLRK